MGLIEKIRDELRDERNRLEGDLKVVRAAQRALDPRTRPRKKRKRAQRWPAPTASKVVGE